MKTEAKNRPRSGGNRLLAPSKAFDCVRHFTRAMIRVQRSRHRMTRGFQTRKAGLVARLSYLRIPSRLMRPVGQRIGDQFRDRLDANDGVVTPALAVDDKQVDGQFHLNPRSSRTLAGCHPSPAQLPSLRVVLEVV